MSRPRVFGIGLNKTGTISLHEALEAIGTVDDWRWAGPTADFPEVARDLGAPGLAERAARLARAR